MQSETQTEFSCDFAPLFDPPLGQVDVVSGITKEAFESNYRRPRRPVIIDDGAKAWPALKRWQDPAYLVAAAGHRPAFVRDLDAGNIDSASYHEAYQEVRLDELVERLFSDQPPAWYLTQGLIMRGDGLGSMLGRSCWPASLPELACDLVEPPFWPQESLTECNLWLGPGGQSSGLHYDEYDNLNGVVLGSKRWLLFPHDQAKVLLNGARGRDSIAPGFHFSQADRFANERGRARGYECITRPGQLLYVPAGMWHQVFSSNGPSLAVNYWYLSLPRDAVRSAVLHARRYSGFAARKRFLLVLGVIAAKVMLKTAQYGFGKRAPSEIQIGQPGYRL
ncbi:hypothetical protein LPB72_03450 [Hydrogenophaga crassostreae]|uniref:JmjC domain-containing protein n=1 Tax=Hydrogenophaga crassostreae TaxID=1763535 RepID=A0A162W3K0_9BURK|nr:cupin-like domain-containing protein [Hydrogenophaga crassostreae]AOW14378.1 hypothetical protein LPB072_17585 [Hydrogenophaga crassostreae]OAD43597.1 hypothetical protein LPB72_03450 [Hydrogenophaga crassostreae]